MTSKTVFFNSWNDGLPVEIFLNHLHHSLRLGSRQCNGKYRLLSKAWKALVDANVAVLSCMEFCRDCDGNEHYWPNFPALQVVTSLLFTISPLNLREIDIPTTEVTEGLLEAVLSKTSLDQLTLSGHGPSIESTNPVLAKFSQLVHLESINLVGSRLIDDSNGLAHMSVSWWFKGTTLAAGLRGIPELTTATLYNAGTAAQNGHQVATSFIMTLPSSSLKHLVIYSDENVMFTNAFLALSSFLCLVSLAVLWGDGMTWGEDRFPGGARWSRELLLQLQPLRNLREVTVTKLPGTGQAEAARYLPNVHDWGLTNFASPDEED